MNAIERLRGLGRRIKGRFGPKSAILLYHRVTEYESDPYRLCITPENFEQHLKSIRKIGHPLTLTELARHVRKGNVPERAVCVTFDDGYQDNLYAAKPLLERYDIPATVFVTTGTCGRKTEFWWDQLENVFLSPGSLPSRLRLEVSGTHIDWDLEGPWSAADVWRHREWTMPDTVIPTKRHNVFCNIYALLQQKNEVERTAVLGALWEWAGRTPELRSCHRTLLADEVVELEKGGLVEVGAHTVSHPALPHQDSKSQRAEIVQCKITLEGWVGHNVPGFAYPYGLFSSEAIDHVREAGFEYACVGQGRPVGLDSPRFLLPRVDAFDWEADVFERRMEQHLST